MGGSKSIRNVLIHSERKLAGIFNHLPDATFVINREGIVIAWNKAIEEMTGVKADEMLGKGEYEYALPFMDTGDRSLSTRYLNQTPQSGTTRPSSKEKETK